MIQPIILVPAHTSLHHALHQAITHSGLDCEVLYGHSDLPKARSVLLTNAMQQSRSRVILVDSDTLVTPEALQYLAQTGDVHSDQAVCGRYVLKNREQWSVDAVDPENVPLGTGKLFEVKRCGLGVMSVSLESLLRVAEHTGPVTEEQGGGQWFPFCVPQLSQDGEHVRYQADDFSFCARLAQSGTKIMCKENLIAGHAMTTIVTECSKV